MNSYNFWEERTSKCDRFLKYNGFIVCFFQKKYVRIATQWNFNNSYSRIKYYITESYENIFEFYNRLFIWFNIYLEFKQIALRSAILVSNILVDYYFYFLKIRTFYFGNIRILLLKKIKLLSLFKKNFKYISNGN